MSDQAPQYGVGTMLNCRVGCIRVSAHAAPLHCVVLNAQRMPAWPMTEEEGVGEVVTCGAKPPHNGINPCQREPGHDGQHRAEARREVMPGTGIMDGEVTRYWSDGQETVGDGVPMASNHVPYTGKPHRPDYYKPKRKNPRIDPSADASDVTHAWGIDDPRIASAIERLLRAGKKPGEPLLKDLHKTMEEIHRAIEYAEMGRGE